MFRSGSSRPSDALRATLEHARKAPYYERAWKGLSDRGGPFEMLARLPLLDKETAARVQEELVVTGVRAQPEFREAGIVSSATTRQGRPLRMLTSPDESEPSAPSIQGGPDRSIRLYSPRHGVPTPDGRRVFLPATLHPNTVDVLDDLLNSKGARKFRYLVGPLSALKWLTVALLERGVSPARYQLRGVGTTGHALTMHARSWLEPLWRAPFFDNYSLSELRGFAHPCASCGFSHWHGAPTHFELIDPLRAKPSPGPLGELVATALVPGALRMPLIRYRTGDVVEVGPSCRRTGTRGVRFRGRISQSLLGASREGTRYLVLSRDLQEVAEAQADVALEPHPAEVLERVPPSDIGVPRAKIDFEKKSVKVELRYDPARHPLRAAEVKAEIERGLFGHKPKKGAPVIELLRPGSVDTRREGLKLL